MFNVLPFDEVAAKLQPLLQAALLPFVAAQQLHALVQKHGHVRYVPTRELLRCVQRKLDMDDSTFHRAVGAGGGGSSSSSGSGANGVSNGASGGGSSSSTTTTTTAAAAAANDYGNNGAFGGSGGRASRADSGASVAADGAGHHAGSARNNNNTDSGTSSNNGTPGVGGFSNSGSPAAQVLNFLELVKYIVQERRRECASVIKNAWTSLWPPHASSSALAAAGTLRASEDLTADSALLGDGGDGGGGGGGSSSGGGGGSGSGSGGGGSGGGGSGGGSGGGNGGGVGNGGGNGGNGGNGSGGDGALGGGSEYQIFRFVSGSSQGSSNEGSAGAGSGPSVGPGGKVDGEQLLNQPNGLGRTAFYEACATGNLAAAKYLCRLGADLTRPDLLGVSPLQAAQVRACASDALGRVVAGA
jgi:hypothetical protein